MLNLMSKKIFRKFCLSKTCVYVFSDSWDCIATVFFIDTAHNIISYIETIYNTLKPGGIWVNLGRYFRPQKF